MVSLPDSDSNTAAPEIRSVLVLGGGSAGLLAALTLKRLRPGLQVMLARGGAGDLPDEATTMAFPAHFFETLGLDKGAFYREFQPTWKHGTRFLWGPREDFLTGFEVQYDQQIQGLPKATGYYVSQDCRNLTQATALMERDLAFPTGPLGKPLVKGRFGFHIGHERLLGSLETFARDAGVEISQGEFERAERAGDQVTAVHFKGGATLAADLFIDATGSAAGLIGQALDEPFLRYADGLACDRMVTGGWPRTDEPIHPFTTVETMDHGWCWQVEHESAIGRGYVYSSDFVSDEDAEAEFRAKNPQLAGEVRVVKFRSGHRERCWVGNVVAVGDAAGYVEPLASTSHAQVLYQLRWLTEALRLTGGRPDEVVRATFNRAMGSAWDEIRDLLAVCYKFNTRRATPFWQHCREKTSLGGHEALCQLFGEVGPSPALLASALPARPAHHGVEAFLELLVGMQVFYERRHLGAPEEFEYFNRQRAKIADSVKGGVTVRQALDATRKEGWQWT